MRKRAPVSAKHMSDNEYDSEVEREEREQEEQRERDDELYIALDCAGGDMEVVLNTVDSIENLGKKSRKELVILFKDAKKLVELIQSKLELE